MNLLKVKAMNVFYKDIDNNNIPYHEIDVELILLIKILNTLNGIKTISCCCGHGKTKCMIYIAIESIKALNDFCFKYLNPFNNWHFEIENNINCNQDYILACLMSDTSNYNKVCKEIESLTNKIVLQNSSIDVEKCAIEGIDFEKLINEYLFIYERKNK